MRLLTAVSSKSVAGTETAYGDYARKACVFNGTLWEAPGLTGQSTNLIEIAFPQASSAGAGDIVGFDFVNTASGVFTVRRLVGVVSPARAVVSGKAVRFPAGSLIVTA